MEEVIITFIIIGLSIIIFYFFQIFNNQNKDIDNKNKFKNKDSSSNNIITNQKIISEFNLKPYSFSKPPFKILKEEDHITCFLNLSNKDFLLGQMNGMISYYNGVSYKPILLILEHCVPVTSLFQLHDQTILTSSADGTMRKIKILLNSSRPKKYLVEFVFYTNKEFIFKSIQMKNNDDIISCNISKELILWKKNKNDDYPLYNVEKILLNGEYVQDLLQINENIFITSGDALQFWNCSNYKLYKRLLYRCKGNNSLYKINEDFTGVLLENDGELLLINNNTLEESKIYNLTNLSLTCLKFIDDNIMCVGTFDSKNRKSFIKQYLFCKNNKESDINNYDIKFIEIKSEIIDNSGDYNFSEKNWIRINIINKIGDKIILGLGGEENNKNFGQSNLYSY